MADPVAQSCQSSAPPKPTSIRVECEFLRWINFPQMLSTAPIPLYASILSDDGRTFHIHAEAGKLVILGPDGLVGEEALAEILKLEGTLILGRLPNQPGVSTPSPEISDVQGFLLTHAHQHDESNTIIPFPTPVEPHTS